jgi:Flp pilus assembly protein TadG
MQCSKGAEVKGQKQIAQRQPPLVFRAVLGTGKALRFAGDKVRLGPADDRGSVAVYFSLALFPILMMTGAVIDYGRALSAKAHLQSAVDAATVAVVQSSVVSPNFTQGQRLALAQKAFSGALGPLANTLNVTVGETDPTSAKNYYEVTASTSVPTAIMGIAKINSMPIRVKSGGQEMNQKTPGGGCVLSLDNSAVDAFYDNGNASVTLTSCDIYDNSSNGAALAVGGSATLTARKVSVTGGVTGASKITTTGGIFTGAARTPDPYANVPIPAYLGCDHNNYSTTKNDALTPGVFCGGIQINSKAVVTMAPGLYVIDGGSFTINGQASLSSITVGGVSGVTIVFTSSKGNNWPTVTFNGGGTINLTAPTTTDIANGNKGLNGILFYGDRNMPVGTSFKINGGSTQILTGAIYLPEAAVTYSGNTGATNPCLQLIGDTITFTGNSNIAITGCGNYKLVDFGVTDGSQYVSLVE